MSYSKKHRWIGVFNVGLLSCKLSARLQLGSFLDWQNMQYRPRPNWNSLFSIRFRFLLNSQEFNRNLFLRKGQQFTKYRFKFLQININLNIYISGYLGLFSQKIILCLKLSEEIKQTMFCVSIWWTFASKLKQDDWTFLPKRLISERIWKTSCSTSDLIVANCRRNATTVFHKDSIRWLFRSKYSLND